MIKASMRYGSIQKQVDAAAGGGGTTNITNVSASATTLSPGSSATVSATLSSNSLTFAFGIPEGDEGQQGQTGPTGNGIASISKTGTSGLVDTYTITYTNGNTDTFTVTNGQDGGSGATETGTYNGAGNYGSSHPVEITFTNAPATVTIGPTTISDGYARTVTFIQDCNSALGFASNGSSQTFTVEKVTWTNSGKKLSFYCTNNAARQFNASGVTYKWVAIS